MISNLVIEAMLVAFCAGGALGALITLYFQDPVKRAQARLERQRASKHARF